MAPIPQGYVRIKQDACQGLLPGGRHSVILKPSEITRCLKETRRPIWLEQAEYAGTMGEVAGKSSLG